MTPEKDTILHVHPKDQPFWETMNYDWLIPHLNSEVTGDELVALVKEHYGEDMNWYDRKVFPALIQLAHWINELNRHPLKRNAFPLPPMSDVDVQTGVGAGGIPLFTKMDMTPWMEEVSSYTPAQREVRMLTNGEYKRNPQHLLTTLFQSVDSSSLFASSFSFNNLLHCVRDDDSNTIQKYRNINDPTLQSSIAVILPNGMVKVFQRRGDQKMKWNQLAQNLLPFPDEHTFTLEELAHIKELNVQHVIDASGESARRKVPPYCLSPTAHSGFSVDLEKGELYGSFDHAIADGTVMQSFFMQIMYDVENHHQSGLLRGNEVTVAGQDRGLFTLLSDPEAKKQAIGMLDMPDIPYTDMMMVLMQTRANEKRNGLRSITGTATSNYPRQITGNPLFDHYAAMENRISIFQEQFGRHKEYIGLLNAIKGRLQREYGGDAWIAFAQHNYADRLLESLPRELLQQFVRLRDQSAARTKAEIAAARDDRNMSSKIITMFHGPNMSRKATSIAQRILRKEMLGNVNGTLLSQMTLDEGQARPKASPDYFFTTITPDRNNAGLTKLRRKVITNRAFYRKNMSLLIDDLDRDPQTLARTSHVLYVEDKNPAHAREQAVTMLKELYDNWILMTALIDMAA